MDAKQVEELKQFVHLCRSDPSVLYDPSLGFFKDYLQSFGAQIPRGKKPVFKDVSPARGPHSGLMENFQAAEEAPLPMEELNSEAPVVKEEAPTSVEVPNSAVPVFEEVAGTSGCGEAGVATSLPGDSQIDNVAPESISSGGEPMFDEFPEHGIEWLVGSQLEAVGRSDAILEAFIGTAKANMQTKTPPPFDTMRDILKKQTVAYHLMGFAKEPWMAAIGSVWGELCRLHEAAAWEHHKLEVQQLEADICVLTTNVNGLDSKVEEMENSRDVLESSTAKTKAQIDITQEAIQSLLKRIEDLQADMALNAEKAQQMQVEEDTLLQQHLKITEEISAKKHRLEELGRKRPRHL